MNNMTIKQLIEFYNTANDQQRDEISKTMADMNVQNRNVDKTGKFAEKIIKKENDKKEVFVRFLESKSANGLIYSPTQVGKSAATRVFIETCFKYNTPVIVSTDNKTDQQEQLYYRIENDLMGADVRMLKVSDKNFEKELKNLIETKNKRFVIFCLDNATQIEKTIVQIAGNYTRYPEMKEIKRIAIIHDEADTITKDQNTEIKSNEQAASHKKWLELNDMFNKNMGDIDLKRVFVTATPENCVMLYKIECPDVMRLEIPQSYTGYESIQHIVMEDDIEINKLLHKEINRINEDETYEAVLYCIDRKIVDGHDILLKSLSNDLDCVVNTYNGKGITTYMRTKELNKKFEVILRKMGIKYTKTCKHYQIKELTIRKFYSIIKKIGEKCIITIGKDLICRGISYVGEDKVEPITATTMFYKPGKTMHAVGICQTIGRITGCAMSELTRRLYTPKDVYDTYMNYNKNQEIFMKQIEKGTEGTITKDIIDELTFKSYTRSVDRSKLKLKMNMVCESESDSENESVIDGVNLEKLKKWINGDTLVGKMINILYEYDEDFTVEELKDEVKYEKSDEEFLSNIKNGKGVKCRNGKLWSNQKNKISLNKNIRMYIDEM